MADPRSMPPGQAGPRPGRPGTAPLGLIELRAGEFGLSGPDGRTAGPPDGTFNFVRVHDGRPGSGRMFVSPRLPHADLAQGRPVIYAGTAGFRRGTLDWWSNYSGTYQPVAAFRAKARLPEDKFVPWQRLQMGGLAQQRGAFAARPAAQPPEPPRPAQPVSARAENKAANCGPAAAPARGRLTAGPQSPPRAGAVGVDQRATLGLVHHLAHLRDADGGVAG